MSEYSDAIEKIDAVMGAQVEPYLPSDYLSLEDQGPDAHGDRHYVVVVSDIPDQDQLNSFHMSDSLFLEIRIDISMLCQHRENYVERIGELEQILRDISLKFEFVSAETEEPVDKYFMAHITLNTSRTRRS